MKKLLLGLALSCALTACQPLVPAAAPVSAQATSASHLSLPEAYTEGGVVPGATDVLLLKPTASAIEVPLRYERSVEETLVWEGEGTGVAELYNEHGQLLYRVQEGAPAQTVTVAAGRHTLKIQGAASQVLAMPKPEGAASQLRRFARQEALMALAEADLDAETSRGPVYITRHMCDHVAALRREMAQSQGDTYRYTQLHAQMMVYLKRFGRDLRQVCPDMTENVPPALPQ